MCSHVHIYASTEHEDAVCASPCLRDVIDASRCSERELPSKARNSSRERGGGELDGPSLRRRGISGGESKAPEKACSKYSRRLRILNLRRLHDVCARDHLTCLQPGSHHLILLRIFLEDTMCIGKTGN
jgi:hypothetical protein